VEEKQDQEHLNELKTNTRAHEKELRFDRD